MKKLIKSSTDPLKWSKMKYSKQQRIGRHRYDNSNYSDNITYCGGFYSKSNFYRRRQQILDHTQTHGQSTYRNDIGNNLEVYMTKSGRHSIIRGFPAIQNKLKIIAALGTFIFIIIILAESVVIVQAGHTYFT